MATRATGAAGIAAAAAPPPRASQAVNAPPAPTNSSRRLILLIVRLLSLIKVGASAPREARRGSGLIRQPAHLALDLGRYGVDFDAAREHGEAAALGRDDDSAHARLAEAARGARALMAQDEHRDGALHGLHHEMRHVVPAEPAAVHVAEAIGSDVEGDPGGERPAAPHRLAAHDGARRGFRGALERHADLAIEGLHLLAQACTVGAAAQVFFQHRGARAGYGADQQPCLLAGHGSASPGASGTAPMPHSTRSLLRARNRPRRTAVAVNPS